MQLIKLIRPTHWLKNLLLFFPVFLDGSLFEKFDFLLAVSGFLSFSFMASAIYIMNDYVDMNNDRLHPVKKYRPLASCQISPTASFILLFMLLFTSFAIAATFHPGILWFLGAYFILFTSYSFYLKNQPLLDIFSVSLGFLIRVEAGGVLFDIALSPWLLLSVFFLSLFLSIGKRLSEKMQLGKVAGQHRQILEKYPDGFLDGIMILCAASVLVTYSMYIVGRPQLLYTILICSFGLFRYLLLVKNGANGDPTEALFGDKQLCVTALLWLVMIGHSIYFPAFFMHL